MTVTFDEDDLGTIFTADQMARMHCAECGEACELIFTPDCHPVSGYLAVTNEGRDKLQLLCVECGSVQATIILAYVN